MARRHLDWMAQAEKDFAVAKRSFDMESYDWCCFACQQACEKALKSLQDNPIGEEGEHSISQLMIDLKITDEKFMSAGKALDKYYYVLNPDYYEKGVSSDFIKEDDARKALENAELIFQYCRKRFDNKTRG